MVQEGTGNCECFLMAPEIATTANGNPTDPATYCSSSEL